MSRDKITLRIGSEFNPEKRVGEPRKVDGESFMHVWYTYEIFTSYATDKMMQKLVEAGEVTSRRTNRSVLYERVRYVYYKDGVFYRAASNKNERREGSCYNMFPFDGTLEPCYPKWCEAHGVPKATIRCTEGHPTSVELDGEVFEVTDESWPAMEAFLLLDGSWKKRRTA